MDVDDRILINMAINNTENEENKEGYNIWDKQLFEEKVINRYYKYKGIHMELQKLAFKKR